MSLGVVPVFEEPLACRRVTIKIGGMRCAFPPYRYCPKRDDKNAIIAS
jgi:hypothetical protein